MKVCRGCPHWAECVVRGDCLTDIAAPFIAANQFSRWMLPDQARAVEDALRSGKSYRQITTGGSELGPALCTSVKWKNHCEAYPLWGAEMQALASANAKAHDKLKGVRTRTHCKRGHALPSEPNFESHNGRMYARCMVCQSDKHKRGFLPNEEVIGRVMVQLLLRRPINSFTAGGSPGYLLSHKNFTECRKRYPEIDRLARQVIEDRKAQPKAKKPRKGRAARQAKDGDRSNVPAKLTGIVAARPDATHSAIDRAVPRTLPTDMRNEIINDIWLAVRDGAITLEQMPACVKRFTTAHNKMFPTKFAKFGNAPLLSLDAAIFEDGSTTRGDMVSQGLWQ